MRKNNNRFRGNNNNSGLNYRFDSLSPAGKYSGTALDLIKRYNELAKEAGAAGNYVEMEVFRQYAEHYRKIVTEFNERKNLNQNQQKPEEQSENTPNDENTVSDETSQDNNAPEEDSSEPEVIKARPLSLKRKTLKIVEVKESEIPEEKAKESQKEKKSTRITCRKTKQAQDPAVDSAAS